MNKLELLKKLSNEELEFYKKLISFFEVIGISEDDLFNMVALSKQANELIDNNNKFAEDIPMIINRITLLEDGKTKVNTKNELTELNTPVGSFF